MFLSATYGQDVSQKQKNSTISSPLWHPEKPYNELPLLPPATDLETRAVLRACGTARAALGELKGVAELIPNQEMLITTLPVLEAQASSEIENIVTTADRLFQFRQADEQADPATKEAIRYSHALLEASRTLQQRPLNTRTAELICTKIRGVQMRVRNTPGTVVASGRKIIYTPPQGEGLLRDLLANWERYLHEQSELDPLIRLAVAHYQFEAIHPFTDGNGRTGRIINSLFLIQKKLLSLPILYLSRYIIKHRAEYYRALQEVTRASDWESWVLYLIRGIEETARWTIAKINAIRDLFDKTLRHIRRRAPKIYSYELVSLIFEQPYCRIVNITRAGLVERQAASRYLQQLVKIGVLEEKVAGEKVDSREKLFVHPRLMQLLVGDRNVFTAYPEHERASSTGGKSA